MTLIRISRLGMLSVLMASCLAAQEADGNNAVALMHEAIEAQQAGDNAKAADAYRAFLKQQPGEVAAHVNLGIVLVKLGRYDEAIAEYRSADRLLPGDPRIALNLALAYEKSGRISEAADSFELLHRDSPQDTKLTMLLADSRLQLGQNDRVIELLQPLEAQNSDDPALAYMLGMALLRTGRSSEGQVLLDRILRNGDTPEARFLLATRMFESGDYPGAVQQLGSAAALNPNLPELQALYGQALLNTGDSDAAAKAFHAELAGNPNNYAANLGLGQILTVRKNFSEALPPLERAVLIRPDSPEAKLSLAECLSASSQFGKALPLAESAAQGLPNSAQAHETLATVYAGLHRSADASRETKSAKALRQSAAAVEPGPKVHDTAPDFELADSATGKTVSLRDFRDKSPVVLLFGSYSCPNFRSAAEALKSMGKRYGARVPFLLIYIREAHGGNTWESTRNQREGIDLAPAASLAEKQDHAAMCSRKLHLPFPSLVDGMDGAVENAYNAWPSRAFIIDKTGHILYSSRLTELDFHAAEMEAALRAASGDRAISMK